MGEAVKALCYGCVWGREARVMHNLCTLSVNDQVRFCLYYALDFVNEAEILEQYGEEMGLGGLEWVDIFDHGYRHSQWMVNEEWLDDMTARVIDKWTSQGLSSHGGRSSVLPLVESEGGRTKAHVISPPSDWVRVVVGQTVMSKVLPVIEFMWWQDSVLPVIEFIWWQDKSGMICNLTTHTFSHLSCCILDELLLLWNRATK